MHGNVRQFPFDVH